MQDEIAVCGILLSRSDAHLQALAQAFPQRHKKTLSQMYVSLSRTARAVAEPMIGSTPSFPDTCETAYPTLSRDTRTTVKV